MCKVRQILVGRAPRLLHSRDWTLLLLKRSYLGQNADACPTALRHQIGQDPIDVGDKHVQVIVGHEFVKNVGGGTVGRRPERTWTCIDQ